LPLRSPGNRDELPAALDQRKTAAGEVELSPARFDDMKALTLDQ
jgi:hypothetical protein